MASFGCSEMNNDASEPVLVQMAFRGAVILMPALLFLILHLSWLAILGLVDSLLRKCRKIKNLGEFQSGVNLSIHKSIQIEHNPL